MNDDEDTLDFVRRLATFYPETVIDLQKDGPLRMGIPSNVVRGVEQSLARKWSVAFHEHPDQPDGVI